MRDALALTMQNLFHLALGFLVLALLVSLFLKEIPLRRSHGEASQAVVDEVADVVGAPEPAPLPPSVPERA